LLFAFSEEGGNFETAIKKKKKRFLGQHWAFFFFIAYPVPIPILPSKKKFPRHFKQPHKSTFRLILQALHATTTRAFHYAAATSRSPTRRRNKTKTSNRSSDSSTFSDRHSTGFSLRKVAGIYPVNNLLGQSKIKDHSLLIFGNSKDEIAWLDIVVQNVVFVTGFDGRRHFEGIGGSSSTW
jgi:hypothetical protein